MSESDENITDENESDETERDETESDENKTDENITDESEYRSIILITNQITIEKCMLAITIWSITNNIIFKALYHYF